MVPRELHTNSYSLSLRALYVLLVRCQSVQYSVRYYCEIQSSEVQYCTVLYSTALYSVVIYGEY